MVRLLPQRRMRRRERWRGRGGALEKRVIWLMVVVLELVLVV